jgi:membrane-bound metal-dependent hydrolase YbcI (DUF457 family)
LLPLAHAGFAALSTKYARVPALPAVFASLLPDVIDKGLALLAISPSSRWIAHTLFFAIVVVVLAAMIFRSNAAVLAVALGLIFHIALDAEGFLPLFYPFLQYAWPQLHLEVVITPLTLAFEAFGAASLWFVFRDDVRRLLK